MSGSKRVLIWWRFGGGGREGKRTKNSSMIEEWMEERREERKREFERGRHTLDIRIRKRSLTTERIPIRRTQIIHLNHDRICARDRIPIAVSLRRQLPAGSARRPRSRSWAGPVQVLRHGHIVAGIVVEPAGGSGRVAIGGSV